jgi:hypothetical protein
MGVVEVIARNVIWSIVFTYTKQKLMRRLLKCVTNNLKIKKGIRLII